MRIIRIILQLFHILTGVGALAGGYACIAEPHAPLGAPVSMLEGSVFDSFLIPGIVLFVLFGIGNLLGWFSLLRRYRWYGYLGGVLGGAMVIWIVVQVIIISAITFLHLLFFGIGMFQAVVSSVYLSQEGLFPMPLLSKWWGNLVGSKERDR
ncbi:MAG: hypothetical protein PHN93_08850 [Sphaerochaetaceae bacterium]|nr:hypothetical protein [Sphaerochaetaceae bacterium]MDX9940175.1 hypothetical protein [Sphaerochaetaceae bacterium]